MTRLILIYFLFLCKPLCWAQALEEPEIRGKTACVMDVDSRELIYAKSMDRIMYPASMTKLMTALLLAERTAPDGVLTYSLKAKNEEAYKLDLPAGERVTAFETMYGLLLYSGNDIAYMVAENLGGDLPGFAALMNGKAAEWNLRHTRFVTASGLHDPLHYSSAYDMNVILRHAQANPWIASVMREEKHLFLTEGGVRIPIENRNKLAGKDGCVGGKTGWTPEAGRCLAAVFERDGRRMAAVVMDSVYDAQDTVVFEDMRRLMEYAFAAVRKNLLPAGTVLKSLRMAYDVIPFLGPRKETVVSFVIHEPLDVYPTRDGGIDVSFSLPPPDPWPLDGEKPCGELRMITRETVKTAELYPVAGGRELFNENLPFYLMLGAAAGLFIALAALLIALLRRRKRAG